MPPKSATEQPLWSRPRRSSSSLAHHQPRFQEHRFGAQPGAGGRRLFVFRWHFAGVEDLMAECLFSLLPIHQVDAVQAVPIDRIADAAPTIHAAAYALMVPVQTLLRDRIAPFAKLISRFVGFALFHHHARRLPSCSTDFNRVPLRLECELKITEKDSRRQILANDRVKVRSRLQTRLRCARLSVN